MKYSQIVRHETLLIVLIAMTFLLCSMLGCSASSTKKNVVEYIENDLSGSVGHAADYNITSVSVENISAADADKLFDLLQDAKYLTSLYVSGDISDRHIQSLSQLEKISTVDIGSTSENFTSASFSEWQSDSIDRFLLEGMNKGETPLPRSVCEKASLIQLVDCELGKDDLLAVFSSERLRTVDLSGSLRFPDMTAQLEPNSGILVLYLNRCSLGMKDAAWIQSLQGLNRVQLIDASRPNEFDKLLRYRRPKLFIDSND